MNSSKLFAQFVKGYFYFVKTNFKKVKRFLEIVSHKKRGVSSCILGTDYTDFTDIFDRYIH